MGLLKSLHEGREDLRLRFALGRELVVEFYERPGLYLSDQALAHLVADLRRVAGAGQRGKPIPEYGVLSGERRDLEQRVLTVVYLKAGHEPIAFAALCYLDVLIAGQAERVVHLGLTYIAPEHQHRRVSHLLYGFATFILFLKSGMRSYWVSNVTQVPSVVGMVASHYDNVYPRPHGRQTFRHLVLARAIMRDFRSVFGVGEEAGFDEGRQVITNAYTGGSDELKKTFDEAPKHRDPAVNAFCRDWLNYDRGDDVLQIGVWTVRSSLRFLRGKMPNGALIEVLYQAASVFFVGLVTPMVRWVIVRKAP